MFCQNTGLDLEEEQQEAVSDLICNLGHFCDMHDLDFLALVSNAIAVWDAEKREESEGAHNSLAHEKKVFIIELKNPN